MESGREGGTWFGVSSANRLAALSNILELSPATDKKGRGRATLYLNIKFTIMLIIKISLVIYLLLF